MAKRKQNFWIDIEDWQIKHCKYCEAEIVWLQNKKASGIL
jgi:hypothetical protein